MSPSERYLRLSLGYVKADTTGGAADAERRTTFDLGIELTVPEYDEVSAGLSALDRLGTPPHYEMVERNHQELENRFRFATVLLSLERRFSNSDRRALARNLWTPMVNWLTSMRTYLDHQETDLKRRFGKESTEVDRFATATSAAFDNHLGYRFAYRFRNYVQHCQLPRLSIKQGQQPGDPPLSVPPVRILLDRTALLEPFDWGSVRGDIELLPDTFDLLPMIDDAMGGLRSIYGVCLGIELDTAIEAASGLADALGRLERGGGAEGQPALFAAKLGNGPTVHTISPRLIPEETVRTLCQVADGEIDKDSLWLEPGPAKAPLLDPSNVRERFHRDSRGVQVLAAWFTEGGPTVRFRSLISSILEEDGGAEPLLNGLIEVSALLSHMTAAAIGASAEGLVTGILEIYNEFENDS